MPQLTLVSLACLAVLSAGAARGSLRVRRAARRADPCDEPATRLPRRLARLHLELLRRRAELRAALGMPADGRLDLRPGAQATPGGEVGPVDVVATAVARRRLTRLWVANRHVLGGPEAPLWHLHGRLDWTRVGPLGRQVLTLRATLGHDPGCWIVVRAQRRTHRGVPALGGGGRRVDATVHATGPLELLSVITDDLDGWAAAPAVTSRRRAHRRPVGAAPAAIRGRHGRRGVGGGGWRLSSFEVVAASLGRSLEQPAELPTALAWAPRPPTG